MFLTNLVIRGYERVLHARYPHRGFEAFLAIHDTTLGPALGWVSFDRERERFPEKILPFAEAMTWKAAAADLELGGGNAAIVLPEEGTGRGDSLAAFSEILALLGGSYLATGGPGVTPEDLRELRKHSSHVLGLSREEGGSGDPSSPTARGVVEGIRACLETVFGSAAIEGRSFAVQGLGRTGIKIAALLRQEGGKVFGADLRSEKCELAREKYGIEIVSVSQVLFTACDAVVPCATEGILTEETVDKLNCRIVAGAANNQLRGRSAALRLAERGILYAPDFIINAGGIINLASELEPGGYDPEEAEHRVARIRTRLLEIFARAQAEGVTPEEAARARARERIGTVRKTNNHIVG